LQVGYVAETPSGIFAASSDSMIAGSMPAFSASSRWAYHSKGELQARAVTRIANSDWRGESEVL
jgi:hypothetical protein